MGELTIYEGGELDLGPIQMDAVLLDDEVPEIEGSEFELLEGIPRTPTDRGIP